MSFECGILFSKCTKYKCFYSSYYNLFQSFFTALATAGDSFFMLSTNFNENGVTGVHKLVNTHKYRIHFRNMSI